MADRSDTDAHFDGHCFGHSALLVDDRILVMGGELRDRMHELTDNRSIGVFTPETEEWDRAAWSTFPQQMQLTRKNFKAIGLY